MIYEKTFIMAQASSSESPMFMADLVRFMLDVVTFYVFRNNRFLIA